MRRLPATVAALLTVLASEAQAQTKLTQSQSDWTVTLGAEVRVMPKYEGASNQMLWPFPLFSVRRAGTPARFRSPRDGAGIGILDYGRFIAGPAIKIRLARKENSDSSLRGLGDIGWTFEAGAFAEYWATDWLRSRVELRQGIGGHRGLVSDVTADIVMPVSPQLTLSGGPRMTLASAAAMSPYFSITPGQSAASGLPVYDARGGLRSFGAGAQARYVWSPTLTTHMFIEYERLVGDAANAPLVATYGKRDQFQLGIGATYSFDIKPLW